jgi:TPR repeat protein
MTSCADRGGDAAEMIEMAAGLNEPQGHGDYDKAVEYHTKAARLGAVEAYMNLGKVFLGHYDDAHKD